MTYYTPPGSNARANSSLAFYYFKNNNDDAALNKLCIVGRKIQPNPELDPDYYETEYYFGVYENNRGRSNLINPELSASIALYSIIAFISLKSVKYSAFVTKLSVVIFNSVLSGEV